MTKDWNNAPPTQMLSVPLPTADPVGMDVAEPSLIARLEATTGPDRELDRLLCPNARIHPVTGEWRYWNERNIASVGKVYGPQDKSIPTYTASIDAALTLVPQESSSNFEVALEQHKRRTRIYWTVCIGHMYHDAWDAKHSTPAIALCIAALKARAAIAKTTGAAP